MAKNSIIWLLLNFAIALSQSKNQFCPPHFVSTNGKCYYFSESSVSSWEEAFHLCEELEADLLSIETEQENFMIDAYLTKRARQMLYWTSGMRGDDGKWKWKTTGESFTFTKWSTCAQDNFRKTECNSYEERNSCVDLIHSNGVTTWNDDSCNQTHMSRTWPVHYICEKSMSFEVHNSSNLDFNKSEASISVACNDLSQLLQHRKCPSRFFQLADKCYHFSEKPSTWDESFAKCKELNSTLLSIETQAEFFTLGHYMTQQNRMNHYWTSGTDVEVEGQWNWSSIEQPLTFKQWCGSQPDNAGGIEHYLHLWVVDGIICWNDLPNVKTFTFHEGSATLGYICETELLK